MTPTVINLDHNKRGFNGYIISSLFYSVFVVVFHNLMNHYFKEAAKAIIFTSRSPNKSLKASYTLGLIMYLRRHLYWMFLLSLRECGSNELN